MFINNTDLKIKDLFSATWLQNVENFLLMDKNRIRTVEDGAFEAIRSHGHVKPNVRMTVDWLDFCVEHLSKWWKIFDAPDNVNPTKTVISFLRNYTRNGMTMLDEAEDGSHRPSTALEDTLALIAFQPYSSNKELGKELTTVSLAATIASLYQAGFGRVVVVGLQPDDVIFTRNAVEFLGESLAGITRGSNVINNTILSNSTMIGAMQVGHVHVTDPSWFTSKFIQHNVPRSAIIGLQLALKGEMNLQDTIEWLGHTSQRWKYVYLTEPDTILNTRRENLSQLRDAAEKGLVLVPHRLQPIPHDSDIKGLPRHKAIPNDKPEFSVRELDSYQGHSCCDAGNEHPGSMGGQYCVFWWKCGFRQRADKDPLKAHKRLLKYGFMRLSAGTGVVSLAGTVHGRRCIPRSSGTCNSTVLR